MLKFLAKPGHLVHRPGPKQVGQIAHYVGRRFVRLDDEEGKKSGTAGTHAALKEPATFADDSPEVTQLLRYTTKGGLWPADEHTAALAGVPFVKVQFDEKQAEWLPAVDSKPKSKE
jgi:hypothetical protein